jgi:hypothetical protein
MGSCGFFFIPYHLADHQTIVLNGKCPHGIENGESGAMEDHEAPMGVVEMKASAAEEEQSHHHAELDEQVSPEGQHERRKRVRFAQVADEDPRL